MNPTLSFALFTPTPKSSDSTCHLDKLGFLSISPSRFPRLMTRLPRSAEGLKMCRLPLSAKKHHLHVLTFVVSLGSAFSPSFGSVFKRKCNRVARPGFSEAAWLIVLGCFGVHLAGTPFTCTLKAFSEFRHSLLRLSWHSYVALAEHGATKNGKTILPQSMGSHPIPSIHFFNTKQLTR